MRAIAVTDKSAGVAGMKFINLPEPHAAENDVIVEVHASGFVPDELVWPGTWTDRSGRDRTPSVPGHEFAGIVTALGYGTTGLTIGQKVFGITDWLRNGTLAERVAVEARNLAPLPGDIDFVTGASLPISGLTALQGLFTHGQLQAGQTVLILGAAGAVGSMVTQMAKDAGAYVMGTGRTARRQTVLDYGANKFIDLEKGELQGAGQVDLVFDIIGGEFQQQAISLVRPGGRIVSIVGPVATKPKEGLAIDFVVEADRTQLSEIAQQVRISRLKTNIDSVVPFDEAITYFNSKGNRNGKVIVQIK